MKSMGMLSSMRLTVIFMTYSVTSQPTMDLKMSQCLSADQSECCSVNIQFLENMRRGYNPAYSGANSIDSIKYIVKSIDDILDVVKTINKTGLMQPEKFDESVLRNTHEIIGILTNENRQLTSFMSLMVRVITFEESFRNTSQTQRERLSLMNGSINHNMEIYLKALHDSINIQARNITSSLTLESARNSREIQDNLRILYNRTNEILSVQMDIMGKRSGEVTSRHENHSEADTTACSGIEIMMQTRAALIESSIAGAQKQLNENLQTKAATLEKLLQQIISQNENASNVLLHIQPTVLLKITEGQQNENRRAEDLVEKLEQLKNSFIRQTTQNTAELVQQLVHLQQQQNSSTYAQCNNLTTYLQQLQHLQLTDQQLERYMYNNITKLLYDLHEARTAEKIEQLIEKQDKDRQEKRQEKQQLDRDKLEMRQQIEQLKQEQQQQTEQLKQEQQQLTEQLKQEMKQHAEQLLANQTSMNQLLMDINQQLILADNQTSEEPSVQACNCPRGFSCYTGSRDRCYKVVQEKMTWENASTNCYKTTPGGHLAVILSRRRQEALVSVIDSVQSNSAARCGTDLGHWLGARRGRINDCDSEFEWKPFPQWSSSFLSYNNFVHGEPNCLKTPAGNESCLVIWTSKNLILWNDLSCNLKRCSICEVPSFEND